MSLLVTSTDGKDCWLDAIMVARSPIATILVLLAACTPLSVAFEGNSQKQIRLVLNVDDNADANIKHGNVAKIAENVVCWTPGRLASTHFNSDGPTVHSTLTVHQRSSISNTRTIKVTAPVQTDSTTVTIEKDIRAWWWNPTATVTALPEEGTADDLAESDTIPNIENQVVASVMAESIAPVAKDSGLLEEMHQDRSPRKCIHQLAGYGARIATFLLLRQPHDSPAIDELAQAVTCYHHTTYTEISAYWTTATSTIAARTTTKTITSTIQRTVNVRAAATVTVTVTNSILPPAAIDKATQAAAESPSGAAPLHEGRRVVYRACANDKISCSADGSSCAGSIGSDQVPAAPPALSPGVETLSSTEIDTAYACCVAAWRHPELRENQKFFVWEFSSSDEDATGIKGVAQSSASGQGRCILTSWTP
jgi:hypothetical protein